MIVDYRFYLDRYYGDTGAFQDESTWIKYENRAEDKLGYLTFGRFGEIKEHSDNMKKAVCSLADAIYAVDSVKKNITESNGKIVSSMSSLGVSVSYAGDVTSLRKAATDNREENKYFKNTVMEYLQGSGLLYAGF